MLLGALALALSISPGEVEAARAVCDASLTNPLLLGARPARRPVVRHARRCLPLLQAAAPGLHHVPGQL